jgi:hypothetical protein
VNLKLGKIEEFLDFDFMKFISKSKSKSYDENCQEMWVQYFFENIEKSGIHTITGDTRESGNNSLCGFQRDIEKFSAAFSNETYSRILWRQGFSVYADYLKISVHPSYDFAKAFAIGKLIKTKGGLLGIAKAAIRIQSIVAT